MKMEPVYALALCLLVSLCSATSPPPPPKITPLNCNETQLQTEVAADLINERRDEGFVLRPILIKSAFQQESLKVLGGNIYYLDFSVIETNCSVVSGKKWKECSSDKPFFEQAVGDCKAIVLISRPWRILKLLKYDCTVTPVPAQAVHRTCPDCPAVISDITPEIKAKADRLVEKFNKEGSQTSYFKVDHVDRVTSQWMRGTSFRFYFTIKETGCLKAQADANLENCKDLKDNETHVGFCKGSTYTSSTDNVEILDVSCEIYEPRDNDDDEHGHCDHGKEKSDQGKEKPDAKGPGEAGPDRHAHGEHGPERKGHKHHHCRPHHHKHGHHPHHHHHHHHDLNQTHHHDHSHDHHKHHGHHNRTAGEGHGSSSEEHIHKKSFVKKSKGSFHISYNADDSQDAPSPTVPRPPHGPGPHGKFIHDKIVFPKEVSPLKTCPGELLVELAQILKNIIFEKNNKKV